VTGAVFYVSDKLAVARKSGGLVVGGMLFKEIADGMDDLKIATLVPASDMIGLTVFSVMINRRESGGVILDVEPFADLLPVAVDGNVFPGQGAENDYAG